MENGEELLHKLREEVNKNLVVIPAGAFFRGDSEYADESPLREIFLDMFSIHKHLITNLQYTIFLNILEIKNEQNGTYDFMNFFNRSVRIKKQAGLYVVVPGFEMHPVTHINWLGAYIFSLAIGARLPTEAECEKASRGGLERKSFPWGNEMPNPTLANFGENIGKTTSIGSYSSNGYGLYDMAGNVWEWTMDWYHPDYYKKADTKNPTGPTDGVDKVIRGGGWAYSATELRCSKRGRTWARLGGTNLGFRVVVDSKQEQKILSVVELRKKLEKFKHDI